MKNQLLFFCFIVFPYWCVAEPSCYISFCDISSEWNECHDKTGGRLFFVHESGDFELEISHTGIGPHVFYFKTDEKCADDFFLPYIERDDTIMIKLKRLKEPQGIMKIVCVVLEDKTFVLNIEHFLKGDFFVELNRRKLIHFFPNASFLNDCPGCRWSFECTPEVLEMLTNIHKRKTTIGKNLLYRRYGRRYHKTGKLT